MICRTKAVFVPLNLLNDQGVECFNCGPVRTFTSGEQSQRAETGGEKSGADHRPLFVDVDPIEPDFGLLGLRCINTGDDLSTWCVILKSWKEVAGSPFFPFASAWPATIAMMATAAVRINDLRIGFSSRSIPAIYTRAATHRGSLADLSFAYLVFRRSVSLLPMPIKLYPTKVRRLRGDIATFVAIRLRFRHNRRGLCDVHVVTLNARGVVPCFGR
jgi:hypothetical protein